MQIPMVFICINDVLHLHLVLVYCCVGPMTVITCTYLYVSSLMYSLSVGL